MRHWSSRMFDVFKRKRNGTDEYVDRIRRAHIDEEFAIVRGTVGGTSSLYESTAASIKAANFPDGRKFARDVVLAFSDQCEHDDIPPPHDFILAEMLNVAAAVYASECLTDLPPASG